MGKPKTRGMILRPPPELSFQFRVVDLDQGGPAVWAAVGHVAFEGVLKKFLQLFVVKRVVRFHSVATNGGGDHVFAEAEFGHAITGGPDLVDDLLEKALWIVALQKGGEGVDLQRSSTKWFSGETKLVECFEIFLDEVKVARWEIYHDRREKTLARNALGLHAALHLLEQNAFMSGVLVHEDKTFFAFEENVELSEYAHESVVARFGFFFFWLNLTGLLIQLFVALAKKGRVIGSILLGAALLSVFCSVPGFGSLTLDLSEKFFGFFF